MVNSIDNAASARFIDPNLDAVHTGQAKDTSSGLSRLKSFFSKKVTVENSIDANLNDQQSPAFRAAGLVKGKASKDIVRRAHAAQKLNNAANTNGQEQAPLSRKGNRDNTGLQPYGSTSSQKAEGFSKAKGAVIGVRNNPYLQKAKQSQPNKAKLASWAKGLSNDISKTNGDQQSILKRLQKEKSDLEKQLASKGLDRKAMLEASAKLAMIDSIMDNPQGVQTLAKLAGHGAKGKGATETGVRNVVKGLDQVRPDQMANPFAKAGEQGAKEKSASQTPAQKQAGKEKKESVLQTWARNEMESSQFQINAAMEMERGNTSVAAEHMSKAMQLESRSQSLANMALQDPTARESLKKLPVINMRLHEQARHELPDQFKDAVSSNKDDRNAAMQRSQSWQREMLSLLPQGQKNKYAQNAMQQDKAMQQGMAANSAVSQSAAPQAAAKAQRQAQKAQQAANTAQPSKIMQMAAMAQAANTSRSR
jgi:hypothetical protein